MRTATITRNTRETQITLGLHLDNPEPIAIDTDLPFLDHMLNTLAVHGRFGLQVTGRGDVHVDPHHLVEDVGITLGLALLEAVGGQYGGLVRAGHFRFPMDRTVADVALDLCARPNLVWEVPLLGQPLGTLDSRLFFEFFKGFVDAARITLHVDVPRLDNDHHGIEAIFKAFTRALYAATRPLPGVMMSTKGQL
jgi:imidazoleglycerol-phosphate dehydratase